MSKDLGDAALKKIVTSVLNKSKILQELRNNYRKELNSKYHILDLSEEALASANLKGNNARKKAVFTRAYNQFINAVKAHVRGQSYKSIDDIVSLGKKTFYIENPPMLVSPSFEAARANITIISQSIKNNKYFGISNRTRRLNELISEGYTLESLQDEGRIFDPKSGKELELDKATGKLVPRTRNLSKVDLGHTPGSELGRDSPLSEQFIQALNVDDSISQADFNDLSFIEDAPELAITTANQNISVIILNKLNDLADVQANCVVSFKNEIPEKLEKLAGNAGFLSLTLQLYNINNDISVKESAIRNSLLNEIKEEIRKVVLQIPGSNTMEQDIVELAKQRIIEGITGRGSTAKLKPHAELNTGIKSSNKTKAKPKVELGKIKLVTNTSNKPPTVRAKPIKQGYSLASLQLLINSHLQDVISANMGSGNSKNILNYQTGRFAASAKVERMSQSREGMITAFYSYMKNPYQTFEPGYAQGSPKTRDPKLLIAGSIREIAASKVSDRMRAVSL